MDIQTLLKRYFPKELPPTFGTASFATFMGTQTSNPFDTAKQKTAMLIRHEIPRHGLNRRVTGIPNPIFHYALCKEIVDNWTSIEEVYDKSDISRSSPKFIETALSDGEKDAVLNRLRTRSLATYVLKTDISRCFPSIYTHSIPWALHTKAKAKKDRRKASTIGNRLDTCLQASQDGQTLGIPIGPYSSVVISEIILCEIDHLLQKKIQNLQGVRYVDDYELGFKSYYEAELALADLNSILREYELELNQLKTEIVKLPTALEPQWIQQIRAFNLPSRGNANLQRRKLLAYFDEVLTLLEGNSQEHILNYALSKLSSITIHTDNYGMIQDFIFQCLMIDTSTFLRVLNLLHKMFPDDSAPGIAKFDSKRFSELLHHQIIYNCKLKRSHEVAWALWGMMFWKLPISDAAAAEISKMEDSIVALLALHAKSLNILPNSLKTTLWQSYMNQESLYGSQWLLAYEATIKEWLPLTLGKDHVASDDNFNLLRKNNVEFYDSNQVSGFNLSEIIERNIARGRNYDLYDEGHDETESTHEIPEDPF